MEKFFVDTYGKYLGVFIGAQPPEGSIEVPHGPSDGRQVWNGTEWADLAENITALDRIRELEAQITPRRMREAMLEIDDGWLARQEVAIQEERERL